jgi:cation transport ATPase
VEALSHVDTVIFDKTGSLTVGKPKLIQIIALGGITEAKLLEKAAIAEKFSEHPLGRALVQAASSQGMGRGGQTPPLTSPFYLASFVCIATEFHRYG